MTTTELKLIHENYRRAVATAQDPQSTREEADKSTRDACALRLQLDAALIEQRHDEELTAARAGMEHILRPVGDHVPTILDPAIRDLVRPVDPNLPMQQRVSLSLAGLQTRTEYPFAAGDASHTYGSYAVSSDVYGEVIMGLMNESAVLAAGPQMIPTATGNPLTVPTLATEAVAGYRAEGSPATQTTPVLGEAPLSAYNLAGFVQATAEFLTDAAVAAPAMIGQLCGRALGIGLATELAVGDGGSGHITGAFVGATSGKTAASKTTFTFAELQDLRASVAAPNRRAASWLFSDGAELILLKMVDNDSRPLMQPAVAAGLPDTLMGKPVYIDAYGPAVGAGLKPVLFGDFRQGYVVRPVGTLEITRDDSVGFVSWVSTWRFQARVDAGILLAGAIKALTMAA